MTTLATILGMGGDVPLWYSGMTVQKWQTVRSPADGELYTRSAATGTGATDPADDVTNYFAASFRRSAPITGFVPRILTSMSLSSYAQGATKVAPTINAGVRTLLLSATGRGNISFFGFFKTIAAALNLRVEIIADGRAIFDNTIAFPASANCLCTIFGMSTARADGIQEAYAWPDAFPIEFRRSLSVYLTPSAALTTNDTSLYLMRAQA